MKSIVTDVEFIYINEQDNNKKALLKKLYENFRYSDPISLSEMCMRWMRNYNI